MCILHLEKTKDNSLYMSLRLPCIEIATIGGGTSLEPQSNYIKMMGIKNTSELASVIGASVIAGELSLLSALCSNELVSARMQMNRK